MNAWKAAEAVNQECMNEGPLKRTEKMRKLPPLNSLKAFDAVSSKGSISKAAEELSVSASAVSQQVATLESWMRLPLLHRHANTSKLTSEGARFAAELNIIFDELEEITTAASRALSRNEIRISVLPSFAARWLVKRLAGFSTAHNDCRILLEASYDQSDFRLDDTDLAVRSGIGSYPECHSIKLFDEYISPACSPEYWSKHEVPIHRIAACTLLGDETFGQNATNLNWNVWMERQNVQIDAPLTSTHHFTDSNLTIQSAVNGEGMILGRSVLIGDEIQNGTLIYPFEGRQVSDWPYFIVYPQKNQPPRYPLKVIIEWLLREATLTEGIVSPP